MPALDAARRGTASRVLFGLAAGAAILGVALLWTGGFFTRVYGIRISARGVRPILFALLFATAGFRLQDRSAQDALITRFLRWSSQLLPATVGIASATLLTLGVLYGTRADAWWYLRFVLPAFPLIFVLAADVAWSGTRRLKLRRQVVALGIFAVVVVDFAATRAMQRGALGIGDWEQKYADVGRFVASRLPANAVVVTMQHSGSVRYYSGRLTLRYDALDADWLDRAIARARRASSRT